MALPMSLQQFAEVNPEPKTEPDAQQWRWTIDSYFRAGDLGFFPQEKRVELIEGEIFIHVSPIGSRHSAARYMLDHALERVFGDGYIIRSQEPILRPDDSAPEPDISVVPYKADFYAAGHPTASELVLVAEIADSSLVFDRKTKAVHYGRAGIAEYWIVNLVDNQLEVYRRPDPETGYREVTVYKKDEMVRTVGAPDTPIKVADLIPSIL